jgi:hypothetical protein
MRHEPGDEVDVAADAVELGHGDRTAPAAPFKAAASCDLRSRASAPFGRARLPVYTVGFLLRSN